MKHKEISLKEENDSLRSFIKEFEHIPFGADWEKKCPTCEANSQNARDLRLKIPKLNPKKEVNWYKKKCQEVKTLRDELEEFK